jgi:hypothetical protein
MADEKSTPPDAPKSLTRVTVGELNRLADRMNDYGESRTLQQPALQRDLLHAARALRTLLRSFNPHEFVELNGNGNTAK